MAFNVPMLVNLLLKTYALLSILQPLGLAYSFKGLMVGMVYEYLPLMLMPIYASMARVNPRLLEAAEVLGARPLAKLVKVVLPISPPGIASGAVLVYLTSFADFVIPAMLGGVEGYTIGYLIWDLFLKYRNWEAGSALSFLVTSLAVLGAFLCVKWGEKPWPQGGRSY